MQPGASENSGGRLPPCATDVRSVFANRDTAGAPVCPGKRNVLSTRRLRHADAGPQVPSYWLTFTCSPTRLPRGLKSTRRRKFLLSARASSAASAAARS